MPVLTLLSRTARQQWAYLCEDDVGLFDLPTPRVSAVLGALTSHCGEETATVGAVVAYGRRFVGRGTRSTWFRSLALRPSCRSTWRHGGDPRCPNRDRAGRVAGT